MLLRSFVESGASPVSKADQPTPPVGIGSVLEEDVANAMQAPAVYVNRFFFTGMGPNVRLAFAEQHLPDGPTHLRAALVMTVAEAAQLRDLLNHMLQGVQLVELPQSQANG
jgi:hypothetical protein